MCRYVQVNTYNIFITYNYKVDLILRDPLLNELIHNITL